MTDKQAARRWVAIYSRRRLDAAVVTGVAREVYKATYPASLTEIPADLDTAELGAGELIALVDKLRKDKP
jgi:hypothetical protein